MSARFARAIVRRPSANLADGLTSSGLGRPDVALAIEQHRVYVDALRSCGLELLELPEDPGHPDATFVEDTAVLSRGAAVLARPGAASRTGEVDAIRAALGGFYPRVDRIAAPGTLDGGDVCEAGDRVFIGVSERTNDEGARQIARWFEGRGLASVIVDVRTIPGLLHLKSGLAWLGERRLLAVEGLAHHPAFRGYDVVRVPEEEFYAANAVRVNDRVLVAAGFPRVARAIEAQGYDALPLEMSEFRKMDGGLSCLSLRF